MVLKATLQKEPPKQSLPNVTSEAAATAWKVFRYGVISSPYFRVFSPNAGRYGPEITPYLTLFTQFVRRCSSKWVILEYCHIQDVFLWILRNFNGQLFCRTPLVTDKIKYRWNDIRFTYILFHMTNLLSTSNGFCRFDKVTVR